MKTKQKIYIFSGWSNAGKDTCADWLTFYTSTKKVKFATPGKQALAYMLGVPPDLFEDRDQRLAVAPHCQGRTYLQVLIDFYHHRDLVIGADLFPAQSYKAMAKVLYRFQDLAITDMRNVEEVDVLVKLVNSYGAQVIPVWIYGGTCLSSDNASWQLIQELARRTQTDVRSIKGHRIGDTDTKKEMIESLGKLLALT